MKEVWLDIPNLEGKYQVSNIGRVKSLSRIIGAGKGYLKQEQILKYTFNKDGYRCVCITVYGRTNKMFGVHRLVAASFLNNNTPLEKGAVICHKDGDKLNNHVDNLYIGTLSSNAYDRYKTGSSRFDLPTMRKILQKHKEGYSQAELKRMYNANQSWMSNFLRGKSCKSFYANEQL